MPKTLILMRHGDYKMEFTGPVNFDNLTDIGKKQVRDVARKLMREAPLPEFIMQSLTRRAAQTRDVLIEEFEAAGIVHLRDFRKRDANLGSREGTGNIGVAVLSMDALNKPPTVALGITHGDLIQNFLRDQLHIPGKHSLSDFAQATMIVCNECEKWEQFMDVRRPKILNYFTPDEALLKSSPS